MFKFLCSKRGYTFVEVLTVVVVLGILTSVGVPIFGASMKAAKKNDCLSNREAIEATLEEVMMGLIDNGRPQKVHDDGAYYDDKKDDNPDNDDNPLTMYFSQLDSELFVEVPLGSGVKALKLTDDVNEQKLIFTISDVRGGWNNRVDWNNFVPEERTKNEEEGKQMTEYSEEDYKMACQGLYRDADGRYTIKGKRCYLKKRLMGDIPFYKCLSNEEIPLCPFADYENERTDDDYYYYILEDGSVHCTCPDCQ